MCVKNQMSGNFSIENLVNKGLDVVCCYSKLGRSPCISIAYAGIRRSNKNKLQIVDHANLLQGFIQATILT